MAIDKSALKKEYKMRPPAAGVYMIVNRQNGRRLLATSANIVGRFNRYRVELQSQSCRHHLLMQDWLRYGEDAFEFTIVDTLEDLPSDRAELRSELAELLCLWQEKWPDCEYNR